MHDHIKEKGKWAWERWRDFNDVRDLVELHGWKTLGVSVLSSIGTFAWLWEPGNRPLTVLAGLFSAILVVCVSIALQLRRGMGHRQKAKLQSGASIEVSPLEIEFEGTEPVRWEEEQHGGFNDHVRRKHYGISVHNKGNIDVEDVAVEIEKIEQVPNRANEIVPISKTLGLRLKFKTNNATSQKFSSGFRDRVQSFLMWMRC